MRADAWTDDTTCLATASDCNGKQGAVTVTDCAFANTNIASARGTVSVALLPDQTLSAYHTRLEMPCAGSAVFWTHAKPQGTYTDNAGVCGSGPQAVVIQQGTSNSYTPGSGLATPVKAVIVDAYVSSRPGCC